MMKHLLSHFFIFCLIMNSSALISAELESRTPDPQYGAVKVNQDDTLKKLLSIQGVDQKYKDCQTRYPTSLDQIPSCIWNEITPDQKKKVQELYAQEAKSSSNTDKASGLSRAPSSEKSALSTGLTARKVNVGIDYKSDPATKVLSDFFGKKLDEILQGSEQDKKDKKITTIDQSKFIDLYKSELGKSIVNAFTSYCMETPQSCRADNRPSRCLISAIEKYRKDNRSTNIKELHEKAVFSAEEGRGWVKCIEDVSSICYEIDITKSSATDDEKYSNSKACLIMDFVKTSRKNIIAAEEQDKFYDELQKNGKQGVTLSETKFKVLDDTALPADKIIQINSADLSKDIKTNDEKTTSVKKALEQTDKEAEECEKNLGTKEDCKKFLNTNTKENNEAVTAFGLGQLAQEKELEDKLKDDKNVESYLKEEGYKDDQIKEMLKKENIQEVKDKIAARFKNENAAIIKEMADRVSKKTSSKDGTIDSSDLSKMSVIRKELSGRNEDLKDMIHFNNIVSAYLTIESKDENDPNKKKETSRNTASLHAEVDSMDAKDSKDLKSRIKSNQDLKENQNSTSIGVSTINEIFDYINLKKNPKKD